MRTVCSGSTFGEKPPMRGQLRRFGTEQRRERHAVDVAAQRGAGRVHVAVRVHPDQADRLVLAPHVGGGRRHRPGRQAVVAAEHDRDPAGVEDARATSCRAGRRPRRSRWMYFLARVAQLAHFRDRRDQIALVDDREAQRREPLGQPGDAERGGPHVDAAAVAAEIERHADDVGCRHGMNRGRRADAAAPAERYYSATPVDDRR